MLTRVSGQPTIKRHHIVARGHHRTCYRHPDEPGRCIKIEHKVDTSALNRLEWSYYEFLHRRRVPLTHIAACHGWIETNRGRGLVFDRVTVDGHPDSPIETLEQAILNRTLSRADIASSVAELAVYLRRHGLIWSDENPGNLCVVRHPSLRLVIVDGLGGRLNKNIKYRIIRSSRLFPAGTPSRKYGGCTPAWRT